MHLCLDHIQPVGQGGGLFLFMESLSLLYNLIHSVDESKVYILVNDRPIKVAWMFTISALF